MSMKEVEEFLRTSNVKYRTVRHARAYSSQEIAEAAHVPARRLAKVTMIRLGDRIAMAVLPANEMVDVVSLGKLAGVDRVEIATERDFQNRFPDCEVGAMPPFGHLWGMPVFVSDTFRRSDDIAFEAGSHTELLEMPYEEYERLEQPKVGHFVH